MQDGDAAKIVEKDNRTSEPFRDVGGAPLSIGNSSRTQKREQECVSAAKPRDMAPKPNDEP